VDPDEIKAWLTARVVEYKQLREVVLCDSIPKTASGKILRRVIRSQDAERVAAFRVNH
jgi:acyl-coenzyme A synthetase/AMP-(fatty) acid ligase